MTSADTAPLERYLADEAATDRLGTDIAMAIRVGDVIALSGDLGAGKTSLARALIRILAGDPILDVPSPTFTLVQIYALKLPVHHVDLYRLSSPAEFDELGLDEALAEGAALIEWPEHAADRIPNHAVRITIEHEGDGRRAILTGSGTAFDRIARSLAIREFLENAGWGQAARAPFVADASARSYEIVTLPGEEPRVLMNSPRLVLGPPVRDGKPYAEIAHTAQSVAAFVAVDKALAAASISVPHILAQDLERGFLLLDHLGSGNFLDEEGKPLAARYAAAAELLATIHGRPWESRLEAAPGVVHVMPPFDRGALMIEVDLLLDWYVPYITGAPASDALRMEFGRIWYALIDRLDTAEKSLVLRDFHSPNIIWRDDRNGHDRLGIVDFQDALIGPCAYDVASLAMDARVTVSPEIEHSTVAAYVAARRATGPFDEAAFAEAFAIMAVQRNSKILGIFVRLDRRDGKPTYLKHLPRIRDYLRSALAHPALAELRDLYEKHGLLREVSA